MAGKDGNTEELVALYRDILPTQHKDMLYGRWLEDETVKKFGPCFHKHGADSVGRCHMCNRLVCPAHSIGYILDWHFCTSCFTRLRAFFEGGTRPRSVLEDVYEKDWK